MPIQGSDTADTDKEQPHHFADDAAWRRHFARIHQLVGGHCADFRDKLAPHRLRCSRPRRRSCVTSRNPKPRAPCRNRRICTMQPLNMGTAATVGREHTIVEAEAPVGEAHRLARKTIA
jgi:hypothetical protein